MMLTCSSLDVEVKLLTEKQELDDVDVFQSGRRSKASDREAGAWWCWLVPVCPFWCSSLSSCSVFVRRVTCWFQLPWFTATSRDISTTYVYTSLCDIFCWRTAKHSARTLNTVTQRRDDYPTSYRSEERWMFSAASVCLFVNTVTSEWVNIGWWNLGLGTLYKNLGRVRIWCHSPRRRAPQNCSVGLRR